MPAPNDHLIQQISVSALGTRLGDMALGTTELDSHANMLVWGAQATIIQDTGLRVEVNPFAKDCSSMSSVPIVDAVVAGGTVQVCLTGA